MAQVVVELFGMPRQRAGQAELIVEATSALEALSAVELRCPQLAGLVCDGRLSPQFLVSIDGRRFVGDLAAPLRTDARLILLGADAGG
jgi:hypothetical protein